MQDKKSSLDGQILSVTNETYGSDYFEAMDEAGIRLTKVEPYTCRSRICGWVTPGRYLAEFLILVINRKADRDYFYVSPDQLTLVINEEAFGNELLRLISMFEAIQMLRAKPYESLKTLLDELQSAADTR